MRPHEKLLVWQESMGLSRQVYFESRALPKEEMYGLTSQMRRAAVSIPSNIAEGAGRETAAEFNRFLYIARGSLSELETLVRLSQDLGLIGAEAAEGLLGKSERVGKLLEGLVRNVRSGTIGENPQDYEISCWARKCGPFS